LAAAAAGVLNCLWEQELDGRMQRTSRRALPSGRLAQRQAFAMAIGLTAAAVAVLVWGVNALAASLSLLGLCSYVLLYTALLKPRTPQREPFLPWWGSPPPPAASPGPAGGCSAS
jgi:protoheme IX farnesyltransferase